MRLPRWRRPFPAAAALLVAVPLGLAPGDRPRAENLLSLLPPALGTTELYAPAPNSGLALSGYDPVSFFLDEAPRLGRDGNEAFFAGVVWRFASAANRAAFMRDPEPYLPRLGAFDPVAAVAGDRVAGAAEFYLVRDAQLFLFRNAANRDAFRHDPTIAAKAEARWPSLLAGMIKG